MNRTIFQEKEQLPISVYVVYVILIIPISIILLINKLISPLSPSVGFDELDEIANS